MNISIWTCLLVATVLGPPVDEAEPTADAPAAAPAPTAEELAPAPAPASAQAGAPAQATPEEPGVEAAPDPEPPADSPTAVSTPPPPAVRGTAPTLQKRARKTWPKRPILWRVDLGVGGGQTVSFDQDYFGFDDNLRMPGSHLELRADRRLGSSRVFLGGVASYDYARTSGGVHDFVLQTGVVVHEPLLGARLSIAALEGVDPYIEVAGGPSILKFQTSGEEAAAQDAITGNLTSVAGITAYLPKKWLPRRKGARISAGLDFGIGYRFRGQVRVRPAVDDEGDDIRSEGPDLGQVAFRGLIWRLGVFIRFM